MTMKSTVTLAAAAVTAIVAGTAIAASAAAPEVPAVAHHLARPAPASLSVAGVRRLPSVGDTVPANAVAATRTAGLSVFVSPRGDGSGVVIDPNAPPPPAIVAELDAVYGTRSDGREVPEQLIPQAALLDALDAAGTRVLVLYATPAVAAHGYTQDVTYAIVGNQEAPLEFATSHWLQARPTRDLAVAAWRPFLSANPQYQLVDTTTAG